MGDDAMKKLLALEKLARVAEEAQRAVGPIEEMVRRLKRDQILQNAVMGGPAEEMVRRLKRDQVLQSAVMGGPAEEMVRRLKRDQDLLAAATSAAGLVREYPYRLIGANELALISDLVSQDAITSAFGRYPSTLTEAMEAIHTPWVDQVNAARSIAGFAELYAMGHALKRAEPFDETVSAALRATLGDWRELGSFSDDLFRDPIRRVEFYRSLGFKDELTAFPEPAFDEILDITGIRVPRLPPLAPDYAAGPQVRPEDHDEEGFARNERAYAVLLRFEPQLRKFIEERMTDAFGPKWIKQRVQEAIRKSWEDKQKHARDAGRREHPLIAYGDIGDYLQIIVRSDNWNQVFEPIFRQRDEVSVSLRRVHLVRLCTMHTRVVEPEDLVNLEAEVGRLFKAMGLLP